MPTVTVQGNVTLQQAATALQDTLGSRYEVTTHGSGAQQALKVKQSAAATATVHLDRDGDATRFHVHGGGLVISHGQRVRHRSSQTARRQSSPILQPLTRPWISPRPSSRLPLSPETPSTNSCNG